MPSPVRSFPSTQMEENAVAGNDASPLSIISRQAVEARLGISKSTLYAFLDEKSAYHKPEFPRPVRLGRRIGFVEAEIDDLVINLMRARGK